MINKKIEAIIYDLGGVLIGWSPLKVYVKAFNGDKEKAQWFLDNICTFDWNEEQDAGRSIAEANRIKIAEFPEHETLIRKYYNEWEDMLTGPIDDSVAILKQLHQSKQYPLYALTNWSAETFPVALQRYAFLQYFKDIVVSGAIKMRKPFPEIYQYTLKRFELKAQHTLFIDDNLRNVEAARKEGINAIHFTNASLLKQELEHFGIKI